MNVQYLKPVTISIVGVGGYGKHYIRSICALEEKKIAKISSVVIRNKKRYPKETSFFEKRKNKIYCNYEEMLESEQGTTEIVALPVPLNR